MSKTKRITAPKSYRINKRAAKYVAKNRGDSDSIPVVVVLRDILGLAKDAKEVKNSINKGIVLVDGKPVNDYRQPVGVMDILTAGDHSYRAVPTRRGVGFVEISDKDSKIKLSRIDNKTVVKGGKIQLNLHDGTNMLLNKDEYNTKDVLLLEVPDRNIKKNLDYKEGASVVIIKGKNSGSLGKIDKIEVEKSSRYNKVYVDIDGEIIEFPEPYVFVIGDKKPEIEMNGE